MNKSEAKEVNKHLFERAYLFLKSQRLPGRSFLRCTIDFLFTRSLFIRFVRRIAGHNMWTFFLTIHLDKKIEKTREVKSLRNISY